MIGAILKIVSWIRLNLATVCGAVQAILKGIKEILTGAVNLISLFMPQQKADDLVSVVRDVVNVIDDIVGRIKNKILDL